MDGRSNEKIPGLKSVSKPVLRKKDHQINENADVLGVCLVGSKSSRGSFEEICSGSVVKGLPGYDNEIFVITSANIAPNEKETDENFKKKDYYLYFKEKESPRDPAAIKTYKLHKVTKSEKMRLLSGLAIIPLDPDQLRKASSLMTYRPFQARNVTDLKSLNGLVCQIVKGTTRAFDVKSYNLVCNNNEYVLKHPKGAEFHSLSHLTAKGAFTDLHPYGAIILNNGAVGVGVLNFVGDKISPVLFSQLSEFGNVSNATTTKAVDLKHNFTQTECEDLDVAEVEGASAEVNKKESPGSKKKSPDKAANVPENTESTSINNSSFADETGEPRNHDATAAERSAVCVKTPASAKDRIPDQVEQMPSDLHQKKCSTDNIDEKTKLLGELTRIASDKGFIISDNRGEGNCMFYALSEQLELIKKIKISQDKLRSFIVQYIKKNPRLNGEEIVGFVADRHASLEEYLKSMEKDGTWGDEVVLRAVANCYKTYIHVISSVSSNHDKRICPEHEVESSEPLVLGHVQGLHYVSLRRKQASTSESEELDAEVPISQTAVSGDKGQSTLHRRAPRPDAPGAIAAGKSAPRHQGTPPEEAEAATLGQNGAVENPFSSSVGKANKSRLNRLLIDGGTAALRRVFDSHHPNLTEALKTHYLTLRDLFRQKILCERQWDKLFPPDGGSPDSETFDLILLFILLTNITNLPPPPPAWQKNPPLRYNSLVANIHRLMFYYNKLCDGATRTGVNTPTFSALWEDISSVLLALGLEKDEIENLKEPRVKDAYDDVILSLMSKELQAFKSAIKSDYDDVRRDIKDILKKMQGLEEKISDLIHVHSLIRESVSQPKQDDIGKKDAPPECDINNADDVDDDGGSNDTNWLHHLYMLIYCIILGSVLAFCI